MKKLSLLSVRFPKPFPPDECPLHHLSLPRLPMTAHIVLSSALTLLTHQHLVCGSLHPPGPPVSLAAPSQFPLLVLLLAKL